MRGFEPPGLNFENFIFRLSSLLWWINVQIAFRMYVLSILVTYLPKLYRYFGLKLLMAFIQKGQDWKKILGFIQDT